MRLRQTLSTLAAGLLTAVSGIASAAVINVGGVVWDPDNLFDFATYGNVYEYTFSASQTEMHGYGLITQLNDVADSSQFCPNCQLTYTFGGFILTDPSPANLVFTDGWVKFWVQDKSAPGYTAFNALDPSSAGDGALWLSLAGHVDERIEPGTSLSLGTGTLFGKLDSGLLGSGTERGQAGGLLDVVGGLAAANINTNSMIDSYGGYADLNFSSTFLPTAANAVAHGAPPLTGNVVFTGNAVPEPGTLLLLGGGLLGFGLGARGRKRTAA